MFYLPKIKSDLCHTMSTQKPFQFFLSVTQNKEEKVKCILSIMPIHFEIQSYLFRHIFHPLILHMFPWNLMSDVDATAEPA